MATSRPSGAAWHASGRTDVERNCYQPQRKQRPHLPLCLRQYSNWWTSGWRRRTGPFGPRRWPEHSPAEAEVDSEPCECQKNQIPKYLPVLFVRRSRQEEGNINMLRMFVQSQTIKRLLRTVRFRFHGEGKSNPRRLHGYQRYPPNNAWT